MVAALRAVHHRSFIFPWEIRLSRRATLIVNLATGVAFISAGTSFLYWLGQSVRPRDASLSFKVQSERVHQKLQSKVSQLYSRRTAVPLIREKEEDQVGLWVQPRRKMKLSARYHNILDFSPLTVDVLRRARKNICVQNLAQKKSSTSFSIL